MNLNYMELCHELSDHLKDIPGIISIGLTKKNGQIVLLVAIDNEKFNGGVPKKFRGIDVVLQDLGHAMAYSFLEAP
jgi:hypothetical protein